MTALRSLSVLLLITAASVQAQVPLPEMSSAEAAVRQKVESLSRALAKDPADGDMWGRYGMVLEAHGFTEEASAAYVEAHELDSDDFRWSYYLAAVLETKDPEQAVALYSKAISIDGSYAPAHIRIAQVLETLDREQDAEKHYLEAQRLDPNNLFGHLGLGRIELRKGQIEASIENLERAYRLDPEVHTTVSALARAYHRAGRSDKARELAARARDLPRITYQPDQRRAEINYEAVDRRSYLRRARTFRDLSRLPEALAQIDAVLSDHPEYAEAHLLAADVLSRMQEYEAAAKSARRALEIMPDIPEARNRLAIALFELGRLLEAEREARLALESGSDDARLRVLLSMTAADRGEVEEALAQLERAAAIRSRDAATTRVLLELLSQLGAAFADVGQLDQAREIMTLAVEVAESTPGESQRAEEYRSVLEKLSQ